MRRFHDRILIQRPTRSENDAGQVTYNWSTDNTTSPWAVIDRWASLEFKAGGERTFNDRRKPTAQWDIVLPWDPDVDDISSEMAKRDCRVLFPDERVAIHIDTAHTKREGRGQLVMLTGFQDFEFDWTDAAYNPFPWPGDTTPDPDVLLLESGDQFLLETGDLLLLDA